MKYILILLSLIYLSPLSANAAEAPVNTAAWSQLPVLHAGRVKPIDSFARVMIKSFSNRERVNGLSSDEWLAETIFNPTMAVTKPTFKIFDHEDYNLEESEGKLYSYLEVTNVMQTRQDVIAQLLKTPVEQWTEKQQSFMNLHENFILYTQILRSMTMILPLDLEAGETAKTYLDYREEYPDLDHQVERLVQNKGTNLNRYNEDEKNKAALSYKLNILKSASQNNILLRVVPQSPEGEWLSPWKALAEGNQAYITIWQDMAKAYQEGNQTQWNLAIHNAQQFIEKQGIATARLKTENIYNQINFIQWAEIFYILSFAFLILIPLIKKFTLNKTAFYFLITGLFAHFIHLALRIYILDRPPVGTLYESILFISFICTLCCALMAKYQKNITGILLGSLSGILLLVTAQGFTGDDNMSTLVAVLNTDFWLSTHVICISIGYGICLLTSLMGHVYLVQKNLQKHDNRFYQSFDQNIKTLAILSLLFTTIGTILGGIWADQSWGRFWGWDPKENGALLIVLWLIWMLHSRLSQHLSQMAFAAMAGLLSIIVILAWFGVNLLSVGLHSYGFIDGVAIGIAAFCLLELGLIGALWARARSIETKAMP